MNSSNGGDDGLRHPLVRACDCRPQRCRPSMDAPFAADVKAVAAESRLRAASPIVRRSLVSVLVACFSTVQTAGVRAYVGVTDGDWYRFLAARPMLNEVNFWQPSGGREFRVLTPGEPFFFKSHYPHNRVVGGGFFSGFAQLRISEAWDLFSEGNGVASLEQMRRRVGHYRRQLISPGEDPIIGCVFVRDTIFFPQDASAEPPPDFARNIVQGKSYDLAHGSAVDYFGELLTRLLGATIEVDFSEPWHRAGPVYGDPRLAPQRLGQQAFQAVVLRAYGRRCAITGGKIRPVLEAAHIRPLPVGGEHRLDNGLLLRSDVHTLYDRGYLGVDPKHRLLVSPRLREEFGNGEQFYARAGEPIAVPERVVDRPNREFLEWHLDEVFKAA
jgi:putative restriction endonuclease